MTWCQFVYHVFQTVKEQSHNDAVPLVYLRILLVGEPLFKSRYILLSMIVFLPSNYLAGKSLWLYIFQQHFS